MHGWGIGAGAQRARQAWDRVVTCLGPVNTKPKGLLGHAYEIGGSTEVLAPVPLRHIGQAEACVCLHILTDPGLRGQETGLRHTPSQLQKDVRMRQGKGPQRRAGGLGSTRKAAWGGGTSWQGKAWLQKEAFPPCLPPQLHGHAYTHTHTESRGGERKPVTHSL